MKFYKVIVKIEDCTEFTMGVYSSIEKAQSVKETYKFIFGDNSKVWIKKVSKNT